MAKNILKEAIADAKAVREVALANAKAALEEAFTPKLQSMLSAKLSEELDEEEGDDMIDELFDIDDEEGVDVVDEAEYYDEDEEVDLSEEIDLEEILNELGLEEGMVCEMCGKAHEGSCGMMEEGGKDLDGDGDIDSDDYLKAKDNAIKKATGKNEYIENFNLDILLEQINNLSEDEDEDVDLDLEEDLDEEVNIDLSEDEDYDEQREPKHKQDLMKKESLSRGNLSLTKQLRQSQNELVRTKKQLSETKSTLNSIKTELNEVNLLNSKLLYVNRIFKANNLSDSQKLRVVETLDKASSTKEAKLIYETVKDTFNIKNVKSPNNQIRENYGMASKAAGLSTAPRKTILNESDDMVSRMQKLANIKINQ